MAWQALDPDPCTGAPRDELALPMALEVAMLPTYHRGSAWWADGSALVVQGWQGPEASAWRVDASTGEATCCWRGETTAKDDVQISLAPLTGEVFIRHRRQLLAVDTNTRITRTLVNDLGPGRWRALQAYPDGSALTLARNAPLEEKGITPPNELGALYAAYREHYGGIPTTFYRVDGRTGERREVFAHESAGIDHIQPMPGDPETWLLDLNFPPLFSWRGDDGQTTRCWLLDTGRGALVRELRPRNANRFQMHSNFSGTGEHLFYHGRDAATGAALGEDAGGHYFGVIRLADGEVLWERVYPHFHYGHVMPHPRRETLVINSGVTPDLICELDWRGVGVDGPAAVRILARHDASVAYGSFASYPYPHLSPDGRWLAFHVRDARGTRLRRVDLDA